MSIFLRKIDSAVAVPVYTISENAIAIKTTASRGWGTRICHGVGKGQQQILPFVQDDKTCDNHFSVRMLEAFGVEIEDYCGEEDAVDAEEVPAAAFEPTAEPGEGEQAGEEAEDHS